MTFKIRTIISATVVTSLLLGVGHAQDRGRKKRPLAQLDLGKLPPALKQTGVTYAKDIRPIFEATCFRCHGEEKQKGDLRLDSLEAVLKGGEDGKVVALGDSAKSALVVAVAQIDDDWAMPPKRMPGRGPGGGPDGGRPGGPGGFGRPPGAGGPGGSGGQPQPNAGAAPGGTNPPTGPDGRSLPPRGGFGGSGGPGGPAGPMPKALTSQQVGLVRAWIDQGAK